jgi:HD-GYP domain-containing protein (c-di-GMP phosphodiesterase class II)
MEREAFHAMITNRPYRQAMAADAAIAELQRCSGSQFDRAVVEQLCGVLIEPREPGSAERVDGLDLPDGDRRLLV